MKISMMGTGTPILLSRRGGKVPADRRLPKTQTKKLNDREELQIIALQNRLLEDELQRELLLYCNFRLVWNEW